MSGIYNKSGIWWKHFIPMVVVSLFLLLPSVRVLFINIGLRWFYIFSLAFALSFCLTPLVRMAALRFGVMDMPSKRKIHDEPTPLMGGAAVFISFVVAIAANHIYSYQAEAVLVGAAVLFIIGMGDDVKNIPAGFKLIVQVGCSVYVIKCGIILKVIPESMGFFSIGANIILTILWIVGITNAMNFFDGMDGMAAGLGVIISFFIGLVALQADQPFEGWIAIAMMGSCIGFLPYNLLKKEKAAIFLGDSGSTVIGFILACLAISGDWANGNPVGALISPLLIFWVLIFDMVHITADRIMTGKVLNFRQWIDYTGKDHLHHRMANVFGSQKKSVFFIYMMNLHLGISAVVLRNARQIDMFLLLFQACMIVGLITVLERRSRYLASKNKDRDKPMKERP